MLSGDTRTRTLFVVGAATRDVDAADPRGWRLGGTVAYASLAAARLGVRVRALIGVDALTEAATELDVMRLAGVEIRTFRFAHGPVFENRETPDGRLQIVHQASDRIPATALPGEWRSSSAVLLGTIGGELGDDWATVFESDAFVALAWQGLLRGISPGGPVVRLRPTRSPLVDRGDALIVSAEDLEDDAPLAELLTSRQRLLLTHGDRGALELRLERGAIHGRWAPAFLPQEAADATGAGDVFAAAWLASRFLAPDASPDRHLLVASAMAGLSVRAKGLAPMPSKRDLCEALIRRRGPGQGG